MSIRIDETTTRRWVEMELEVQATPEEVWQAIATGPGISAWFVPTRVEEREGGAVTFEFGGEMGSSTGEVTRWQPPRRFDYVEREWMPGAPPVATEIQVTSAGGGTTVVRMSHSLSATSDEWDQHLEAFEKGWEPYFEILRRYLADHAGARCAPVRTTGTVAGPAGAEDGAWERLLHSLGIEGAEEGSSVRTTSGAPRLAGTVVRATARDHQRDLLVALDEPAPGFALLGAFFWEGTAHTSASLYLYGAEAPAAAEREQAAWSSWMEQLVAPAEESAEE